MSNLTPAHEYADEHMKIADDPDRFTKLTSLIERVQSEAFEAGRKEGMGQLLMIAAASAERVQVPVPSPAAEHA